MGYTFQYDKRLAIELPVLEQEWEEYSPAERADILLKWEEIRGVIPDRIHQLEKVIIRKQAQLDHEDDFRTACLLNTEIADLAGTINELHLWFRINQDLDSKPHS